MDVRMWLMKEITTNSSPKCDCLIKKNDCSHVTYSHCNRKFCWSCKQIYNRHSQASCSGHAAIVGIWWLLVIGIWCCDLARELVVV